MKKQTKSSGGGDAKARHSSKSTRSLSPAMIAAGKAQPGPSARSTAKAKSTAKNSNGHTNGNGNGHAHRDGQHEAQPALPPTMKVRGRATAVRAAAQQPTYDTGLRYDTPGLRYAAADPVPPTPPPGGAKCRLELASRTDSDLAAFAEAHVLAMTGNANFPTPTPTPAVFAQWLGDFEAILSDLENLRVQAKNLTEQKMRLRAGFQAVFTQRGQYIDMASNGDPDTIASSGLPVRRAPTPVGQLNWPLNLRLDLTQSNGQVWVRWDSVTGARSYILQCAEVVAGQPLVWATTYTGGKFNDYQKNLTPGKTYAFRVAAVGGSTGQSDWSPAVQRMAA